MTYNSDLNNLIYSALNLESHDKHNEALEIINSILKLDIYKKKITVFHWQLIADMYLALGKLDLARQAYLRAQNSIGVAFALILLNKLSEAENVLNKSSKSSAYYWCQFLISLFLKRKIQKNTPSLFQIRHFLEFTFYHLLLTENKTYIQLLENKLQDLLEINLDALKLIGYAYLHFGDLNNALTCLNNAIKINQYDGEIFFKLGQLYLMKNDPLNALSMLENARLLLPDHYPTKMLIEKASK